jgi:hypothetical protein
MHGLSARRVVLATEAPLRIGFDRPRFGWVANAILATWLMTLFINRTEHRDTQALHAKLDELLRTHGEARTIEEHRKRHRELDTQQRRTRCRFE